MDDVFYDDSSSSDEDVAPGGSVVIAEKKKKSRSGASKIAENEYNSLRAKMVKEGYREGADSVTPGPADLQRAFDDELRAAYFAGIKEAERRGCVAFDDALAGKGKEKQKTNEAL